MVKLFDIGQLKSGIVIQIQDNTVNPQTGKIPKPAMLQLKWLEAAGLYHALKEVIENPAFKLRDPKSTDSKVIWTSQNTNSSANQEESGRLF